MNHKEEKLSTEKSNGRVYTPNYIVNNILDLARYSASKIRYKHIIDNSCGDGAFLIEVVNRYCQVCIAQHADSMEVVQELETYIHGIDICENECEKCARNLTEVANRYGITGIKWDIVCADSLQVRTYDKKMDFVVGNPPYIRVHNLGDSFDEIKQFSFAQNGMTDLFIVFYEVGLRMLSPNGTLGYITPSSFFNSLAGGYMREQIVSGNYLAKLVDLKHFQAFNTTTYTAIVILENNRTSTGVEYYQYDKERKEPLFVETLRQR